MLVGNEIKSSIRAYDRIGLLYDAIIGPLSKKYRRRAIRTLDLQPGNRLLIVGIGTGLDLPLLPLGVRGVGIDLSQGMLSRARKRLSRFGMGLFDLRRMDAQKLEFPDESFDAVYLPLILAVVQDGARAFSEAVRVAKPGARLVLVDKFWPEGVSRRRRIRALSNFTGRYLTHLDRRFSEIHAGAPDLEILSDEPLAIRGYFRLIALSKPGESRSGPEIPVSLL